MVARRGSRTGLTEDELGALRSQLAGGGRPRVQLSGPQFPPGSAGTVTKIGTPEADGADYVRVRVKVNGMTDELSFAPAELSVRRPGKAAPVPVDKPARVRRAPAKAVANTAVPATQSSTPPPTPAKATPVEATPVKAASPANAAPAGRRRKAPVLPTVTFSITSSGAAWSVTATRGAKNITRNVPVAPGTVTALAELLAQPALTEAVAEINTTALAEAQVRADQLRAELQQLEAVLATHQSPR